MLKILISYIHKIYIETKELMKNYLNNEIEDSTEEEVPIFNELLILLRKH